MKRLMLLLLWALLAAEPCAGAEAPRLSDERVILHTSMGDIVLAVYPDDAPAHAAKFLKMARLGLFDGSVFNLVQPSYFAQTSGMGYSPKTLTADQAEAAKELPIEKNSLKNRRGTLAMTQYPKKNTSASASFTIFVIDVPSMDGTNTVFGEVQKGLDIVEAICLETAPKGARGVPDDPAVIEKVEVVDYSSLSATPLKGLISKNERKNQIRVAESIGFLVLILIGFATYFSAGRSPKVTASMGLLTVLTSFFMLYLVLVPRAGLTSPWIGTALFIASIGIFKLMSFFEAAPPAAFRPGGAQKKPDSDTRKTR